MSTGITDLNEFISTLNQLSQSADDLKGGLSESERVAAIKAARKLAQSLEKPRDAILKMSYSPVEIASVRVAIDLGIFTALAEKDFPMTLDELAAIKDADPIFTVNYDATYKEVVKVASKGLNEASDTVHSSLGMRSRAFDCGLNGVGALPEFFRATQFQNPPEANNGPLQYGNKNKDSMWDLMSKNPQFNDDFNAFMEASAGDRGYWVDWFPVQERLLDGFTGGEEDVLLVDIAGAKVYYMKKILHDWTDSQCQEILQHIGSAMVKGYSKLIIEEFVMPEKDAPLLATLWDWNMLVLCSTMERTQSQWNQVLASAGFQVMKVWSPPGDSQSIIEAELM
ncbi:O-methyltransferase [Penicillium malachiteum]|nr:O-methyltransferase [Penicillium malachiteum]